MSTLKRDCPHCQTKSIAFIAFGSIVKTKTNIHVIAFSCSGCHGGYFAEIESTDGTVPKDYLGNVSNHQRYKIRKEYPASTKPIAPEYLPDNVENFFLQAKTSFSSQNYDAASMMARKVLEVSVKIIHPDGTGALYKRIEGLADEGLITNDLKEWAHIIRENGNESAHEEEPVTEYFASEILSFSEMFLLYVFTMPGMVKAMRKDSDPSENVA